MAPKRATRSARATTTPAPTATKTTMSQSQHPIYDWITDHCTLAACDATRNGTDSHSLGTGVKGSKRVARECTYQDFMKCKPLYFKGIEGVVIVYLMWSNYNQCFQELALLCVRMFPEEADKIKRYVGGLPDMIHGNIVASKPKTMQEAIEMATELMDKRVSTIAERQAKNKRKLENTS
ncbi:hypothetical protein Tco_0170064 [Tanacetum coccineum]